MRIRLNNKQNNNINEGFSAGYISQYDDAAGFSYNIMPLSFNLQQKGNSTPNDKGVFKYYVGDHVQGICKYNDKQYKGIIKHILYNNDKVTLVYIIDDKTSNILPLDANSIRHCTYKVQDKHQMNYFYKNQNLLHQISVNETFDFNKLSKPKINLIDSLLGLKFTSLKNATIGDKVYMKLGVINIDGEGEYIGICIAVKKTFILVVNPVNIRKTILNRWEDVNSLLDEYNTAFNSNNYCKWSLPALSDIKYFNTNFIRAEIPHIKKGEYILGNGGWCTSIIYGDSTEYSKLKLLDKEELQVFPFMTIYFSDIKKHYKRFYKE